MITSVDLSARAMNIKTASTITDTHLYRNFMQKVAFGVIWFFGGLAMALLAWIIGYVLVNGLAVINLDFLTTAPQGGLEGSGGMSTTIVTTLYLVILTILIATPLGVAAAIYLIEYAGEVQRESRLVAWL